MSSPCCPTSAFRSLLLVLFVLLTVSSAGAAGSPVRKIAPGDVPNEYIVSLQGVPREQVDAAAREIARKVDGQVVAVWKHAVTAFWIRVPAERASAMFRDGRVGSIEQNATLLESAVQPTGCVESECVTPTPSGMYPEGTRLHPLWHLARISHRTRGMFTYMYQNGGSGVRAYTIDGGALRFHQEFVPEGTSASGRHIDPNESPRLLEIPGSNVIATIDGTDRLPSTSPNEDCGAAPPSSGLLGGLRYPSDHPWFMWSGAGKPDHGTGVASVLAGRNVGVAKDVTLVPVKALGCAGQGSIAYAIAAADWIYAQEEQHKTDTGHRRPAVVSISTARLVGAAAAESHDEIKTYEAALEKLVSYGIPVFASANNLEQDACTMSPARLSRRGGMGHVISVGGMAKSDDRKWEDPDVATNGSNFGPCVDIIAPAEDIPVAVSTGWDHYRPLKVRDQQSSSGTSYSAPIVAGIAARLLAEDPGVTAKLDSDPAMVSADIWKQLIASATVLNEEDGASPDAPLGDNSPNRIAYMGAFGIVQHPQSYDFGAGTTKQLRVEVSAGAAVSSYEWYESSSPDYAALKTTVKLETTTNRFSTYDAPRPSISAPRKWYWVRAKGPTASEFADSAMAAISIGCAVITQQPQSVWLPGGETTLSVIVSSSASYDVKWYRGVRGKIALAADGTELPPIGTGTQLLVAANDGGAFWARIETPSPMRCLVDSDVAQVRRCGPPVLPHPALKFTANDSRIAFQDETGFPANWTMVHLLMEESDDVWKIVQSRTNALRFQITSSAARTYKIRVDSECGSADSLSIDVPAMCDGAETASTPTASHSLIYAGEMVRLTQRQEQGIYQWVITPEGESPGSPAGQATNTIDVTPGKHTKYAAVVNFCGRIVTSQPIEVLVRPAITQQPADVSLFFGSTTGVKLRAAGADPAGLTVSYQWFDGATRAAITDMPGATTSELTAMREGTYFARVTSSKGATVYTDTKYATVTITCAKPRRRAVRSGSGGTSTTTTIPAGSALTLTVDDDKDGTTFQWFEGTSYTNESTLVGTAASVIVTPLQSTTYWVKMTKSCGTGSESETSPLFHVSVQCTPAIHAQPQSATKMMTSPGTTVSSTASVIAAGTGPFNYQWYEINADNSRTALAGQTTSTYTWSYVVPATQPLSVQKRVQVDVTACGTKVASEIATLTVVKTTPQRVFAYNGSESLYGPGSNARLSVLMEPPPSATDVYTYEWFENDGSPTGRKLTATNSEVTVSTSTIARYWARITGTHTVGATSYTEVTVSPTMYIWRYGTCELPDIKISQNHQVIPTGTSPEVTFVAVCDWPNVTFQWFKGQTGDTRDPMASDSGKPGQLTVSSSATYPYWVRASIECGAFEDSPSLTFSRGTCSPVLIEQNIASVDVAYGGSATLTVTPINVPRSSYTWYDGPGQTTVIPGSSSPALTLSNVIESGRYWVKVRNLDCSVSSDSYLATVRVASCPSMTPPVWQTEVWTDINTARTLTATTGGASGYQWFRGEVGDDSQPISGATLATYTTSVLTAPAKYWVRAYGSGCVIDSPTNTVKVCDPPHIVSPLFLTQNIVSGQRVVFHVDAAGTDLSYQWYKGLTGVTTTPIGQPVDLLEVYPSATSEYWVRVTGKCGAGGTDTRVYNSPSFLASVCPLPQVPTAAKTAVMPNTTTTLSITATGTRLTYQWYKGNAGDRTQPLASGAAATVTTPPITGTTTFWCEVKSGSCARSSEEIVVGLCSEPTVTWSHGDKSVKKGEYVTFIAAATPATPTPLYTFYKGNAGDVAGSTVVRAESSTAYFSAYVNDTAKYWVRARVDNCYDDSTNITVTVCVPQITTQPAAGGITLGGSYTLTVVSDITPVNGYQWYIGDSGVTTTPVTTNGTNSSLTVSPTVDTKYWVRVKGCGSNKADSTAALVSVCTKPAITTSTPSHWLTKGDTQTLSVTATGTDRTYRWYRGATGITTTQIGTASTVSITPTDTTQYWARVSNGCGTADTPTITVSVCAPPAITAQPASQPIFSGKTATLSVTATQATSTPMTYQWYLGTPGSGTAISGATGTTYTTGPLTADTTYWVRITAGTCSTDSGAAVVSMCAYNEVLNAPSDKDTTVGQTVRLQISPISPLPEQVRWYRGAQGVTTTLISSNTYVDVAPTVTTQYWGEFVQGGCTAKTRTVTVFVAIPTITTQPVNTLVNANATATLTAAANTAGVTYQWYLGTSGSGTAISGATAASYTTAANPAGTTASYWVKVTGTRGHTVNSNTAVVTWCTPASITSAPASRNITRGASTWLTVNATGTNLQFAWYRGTTGVVTYPLGTGSVSGGTSSLSVSPSNPEKYWVKVTSDCGSVNSPTVNVDVCVPPAITTQPLNQTTFSWTSATLTVAATAGTALPLSYQWYDATTNDPVPGATSATFTTPALTQDTTYFVEVTSGVCTTSSEVVTVSMCAYGATTNSPSDSFIYANQSITLKVTRSPVAEETRWYRGVSGDRTYLISTNSQVTVAPSVTTQYWGEFSHGGCTSIGRTVTVNVCVPKITTQPASATIARNATKTLSVVAVDAVTYQWYAGTSAGYGTPIAGATSSTYTTPPLTATASYWVRITGSCSRSTDSTLATVTVP